MKSTIKLFKALPIEVNKKKKVDEEILTETVKRGFVFSPEVIANYPKSELKTLIKTIEKEIGLTAEKMNRTFHKSWKKVRDADIVQLVYEQIVHYITTYGFESLGIYDENSVYMPAEKLEIPEVAPKNVNLVIIRGYTKEELKTRLLQLLNTGIALKGDTIKDVVDVATFVDVNEEDINIIKNKEVKANLYDYLNVFPKNPTEFLRYLIYKTTNNTLLIKDTITIEKIKSEDCLSVLRLLKQYQQKYGLENLATIFYRFKPIFLAFRVNKQLKKIINRIRRLAIKHHVPMQEDYLNNITAKIKRKTFIPIEHLEAKLDKVNFFRKVRLAYALKFRTKKDVDSILYRIRNGRSWAKEFKFTETSEAKRILEVVLNSIIKDMKKQVKGKKIYIPENLHYALPITEKQFVGDFPSGTYVTIPKDMIVGIHWENTDKCRVDLDLSMMSMSVGKIGWDGQYRTEGREILFSGDITDAPKPKGATELFYIKRQKQDAFIFFVNFFNGYGETDVDFKLFVAQETVKNMRHNYMVNPNNIKAITKTTIDANNRQKMLGLLTTTTQECRFYFAETALGNSISSSGSKHSEQSRKYLLDFYKNTITLNDLLITAGATIVTDKEKCDIDLSPENITKDSLLKLLINREV